MTANEKLTDEQLLDALEHAGRTPPVELIREAAGRREQLTPTLLAWLADDPDSHGWPEDDPRWYRQIHAGHLLIAWREEAALPVFERWLIDENVYDETPFEWFDTHLDHYGMAAVPMLLRVAQSDDASSYARASAAGLLMTIATRHPEQHAPVVAGLRAVLPPLDADGKPVTPGAIDDDDVYLWSSVAWDLCKLHDQGSQAQIVALHQAGLVDEMIAGGLEDYLAMLDSDAVPQEAQLPQYDVVAVYQGLLRQAEQEREWQRRAEELRAEQAQRRAKDERRRAELEAMIGSVPPQKRTQLGREGYEGGTYVRTTPKVGRNEPCPCGSGRKYKHCHGR